MKMPDPNVVRRRHVAYVHVIGQIWMPAITAAQHIELSDYDLKNIGEFTRDAFEDWLGSHTGDFQSIKDFYVCVGNDEIPWQDEESELTFNDCMYPEED